MFWPVRGPWPRARPFSFPAPAIAQGLRQLKMVTAWPAGSPGLQSSAERLAQRISTASDGRINIRVFPAGTFVGAFETFDAVGSGVADMYHATDYYWEKKSPAFNFFTAVPFGFTANELFAWVQYGGGQELWDALSGQFNIKPLLCLNTGTQMGGWCTREIPSPDAFRGLRYRMPGLGGEVLRRLGASAVTVPGGEIVQSLKSGAIDGAEWVGPWLDMDLGLDKAADYYYYPGFHEPGSNSTLGINKTLWERLAASERALIEAAAQAEVTRSLAEFNAENVKALKRLRADERIEIRRFSDELIKVFGKLSKEVLADTAAKDPLTRKVYDSYMAFLSGIMDWGELSETGYRNTRRLALA